MQRFGVVVDVVVVSDADCVLVEPLSQVLVTNTKRLQGRDGRCIGVQAVIFVFFDVFRDKTPLGVSTRGILDRGVHVDAKTVANTANFDVLIERIGVAIVRQDANVAFTVGHLVLASGVVGHISVRYVFDVTDHAIEDLCDLDIGLVVHWNDLSAWAVLAHVVCDLVNVLWQLVDGQTGARIDRLTLHRATGGQYVSRPLPLVVGRTSVETQVVDLIFTGFGQGSNGHVHA